jgi:general secretion pathway protein I
MKSLRARGFTLLEILVALAVLAIAMGAVLRATSAVTSNTSDLRMRVLADWVAQNRLALHTARGDWLAVGAQSGEETQAGVRLLWREDISGTSNPSFRRVDVSVFAPDAPDHALRKLSGFLVAQRRK